MRKILPILLLFFCSATSFAQTQFWSDDFESATPSSGTRTPSYSGGFGGPPNTRYFKQTTTAQINTTFGYTGFQGTQFWAGEDIDAVPTGTPGEQSGEQNVTWTSINISGKTGLSFRGLFATGVSTVWDHGTSTAIADYMIVEARIDGGPWSTIINFRPNVLNGTNGALAIDANNDGLGDGTALSNTFTEFSANISGTGTTLELRCAVNANALAEELAFDNFRLYETTSLPVELMHFSATSTGNGTLLSWATASEQGSSHFQLERSGDASNFDSIGTIPASGNSDVVKNYAFLDKSNSGTARYYRLKMVDTDGSIQYSNTIAIQPERQSINIRVFPNPVTDRMVIDPGTNRIAASGIQLISTSGTLIPAVFVKKGNTYECNTQQLAPGMYVVRVQTENGTFTSMVKK
ncbi:MAG: T9SS type A sorting domain-containing protein [Chitinophagaceae bacterium]